MPRFVRFNRSAAVSAVAPLIVILFVVPAFLASCITFAQSPAPQANPVRPNFAPNSDATYQALRNLTLGSETVTVNDFTFKRDAATFNLRSGSVCFAAPVKGKVTGAVFTGDGNMTLDPPGDDEKKSLRMLTKGSAFSEDFTELALRFTIS